MEQVRKTKQNKTRKKTKDCLSQLRTFYWLRKETNQITGNFLVQVIGFSPCPLVLLLLLLLLLLPLASGQRDWKGKSPSQKQRPDREWKKLGQGLLGFVGSWTVLCISLCVCKCVFPLLYSTLHTHTHTHIFIYLIS